MKGQTIRETFATLGVIGSLLFVGLEIRASTNQARAAAYQEIGLATAMTHLEVDDREAELGVESLDEAAIADWSPVEWHRSFREYIGVFRIWETLHLQVEQNVLPEEALDRLGWSNGPNVMWQLPAFVCLWPAIRPNTSDELIALIEAARPSDLAPCSATVSGVWPD
jgi:hypothetical protein